MKYTIKRFNFGIVDYKDAEQFLNTMASKGYAFKSTGFHFLNDFAMFEKNAEAKNYKYAVDVRCGLYEEEKEPYYDFYKELGWTNISCYNKSLHIFVTQEKKALPLYTDQQTELENLSKGINHKTDFFNRSLNVIIYACFASIMLQQLQQVTNGVTRISLYALSFLLISSAMYNFLWGTNYLYFAYRCKKSLETTREIPESKMACKLRKAKDVFTLPLLASFPLIAIFGYIYEIWGKGLAVEKSFSTGWEIIFLIGCVFFDFLWLVASYLLFLYPKQIKLKTLYYSAEIPAFILCCLYIIQIIDE